MRRPRRSREHASARAGGSHGAVRPAGRPLEPSLEPSLESADSECNSPHTAAGMRTECADTPLEPSPCRVGRARAAARTRATGGPQRGDSGRAGPQAAVRAGWRTRGAARQGSAAELGPARPGPPRDRQYSGFAPTHDGRKTDRRAWTTSTRFAGQPLRAARRKGAAPGLLCGPTGAAGRPSSRKSPHFAYGAKLLRRATARPSGSGGPRAESVPAALRADRTAGNRPTSHTDH